VQGTDTYQGRFTSPDDRTVIWHDIGWYAGAAAKDGPETLSFREHLADGARVWTARRKRQAGRLAALTLPNSWCANFYIDAATPEQCELLERIASTYRPAAERSTGCM
jgi:hypothetical protein